MKRYLIILSPKKHKMCRFQPAFHYSNQFIKYTWSKAWVHPVGEDEARKPYKYDCLYSENEKPVSEIELKCPESRLECLANPYVGSRVRTCFCDIEGIPYNISNGDIPISDLGCVRIVSNANGNAST
ncbi:hypothetical protein DUI87_02595 [Hirundo rustica rustica]|uniref:Uncharacterized protein n=1 Tax=Hirundo rustica rustica TaxID=333673 RepID=A0A3M0L9N9_HIRRU|nr:hypothetical protein DUI87_02595 [Hirundo rustica rustica]